MKIPNILTLFRIALIPVFVVIFYLPFHWTHSACAIIFALAGVTDWLDGYLARVLGQQSDFGAFLDPVADKLIVAVALILLVSEKTWPLLSLPAVIIVSREILISALREWMAEIGKRASVAVSILGKVKTIVQMIAIILLLLYSPTSPLYIGLFGYILLYISAILTIWSMLLYLKAASPDILNR